MAKVTVIPARKQSRIQTEEAPKLRVAAYCRVSTDSDEQATSYEAQIEHYTEYVSKHPGWVLAGIYADGGISGTNTKKREEFNRLIADCMNDCIDMVITKSISRFARNTLDCLTYIRQLKAKNIQGEHKHFRRKGRSLFDDNGIISAAGKPELITKCASRTSVPIPARESSSLYKSFLGLR